MRFDKVELTEEQRTFRDEVRAVLAEVVTADVDEEEYETGNGHSWKVHRALGARGWLYPDWPVDEGGAGLDPVRIAILTHELNRTGAPSRGRGTTAMVVGAVRAFGSDETKAEVLPRAARGEIIMCLGWTEPESGSDVAAASCRAVQDGDDWVVNGQKFFTSGADNAAYTFLLTRTDPGAAKHRGLTMFLVPLDTPGVEIQPVRTIGGERTTIVFYDDVRVPDRYRLGGVNEGWRVLSTPLAQEHGEGRDVSMGATGGYHRHLRRGLDDAVGWARTPAPRGTRPIDDPVVRNRLARAALSCVVADEAPAGLPVRILGSQALIDGAPDLVDLAAPLSLLERGATGVAGDGEIEAAFRVGPETSIYGGTTDIARSLVAEHRLGLPRSRPTPPA